MDQREHVVQLVLDGSTREAPIDLAFQVEHSFRSLDHPAFDVMGLVEDHPEPLLLVQPLLADVQALCELVGDHTISCDHDVIVLKRLAAGLLFVVLVDPD